MTADDDRLRVGFVGCGRATERLHLPALQKIPGVEVVAVSDIDAGALERVANRFEIPRRSTDWRSLLEDASLDVVAVCVPARFHADVAVGVLEAGKHLFLEKPMALGLDECDRILASAAGSSRKAVVGFNLRCHRLIARAREVLEQGKLGKIQAARSLWTSAIRHEEKLPAWRNQRALGGGVLCEIAVHHFDLWCHLLGTGVEEVHAVSGTGEWPDESAVTMARMTNGVTVTSTFSERTRAANELEIYGTQGRLGLSLYHYDSFRVDGALDPPGGIRSRITGLADFMKDFPKGVSIMRQGGDFLMSYRLEWEHFVAAIRGDRPVAIPLEDGRRAVRIMLAAVASAARGAPVAVADAPGTITPDAGGPGRPAGRRE